MQSPVQHGPLRVMSACIVLALEVRVGALSKAEAAGAVPKAVHTRSKAVAAGTAPKVSNTKSNTLAAGAVPKAIDTKKKAARPLAGASATLQPPPLPPPQPPPPPLMPPWRRDVAASPPPPSRTAVPGPALLGVEGALAVAATKVPPPWRQCAQAKAGAAPLEPLVVEVEEDDPDYDPFTEEPAPHVAEKGVGDGEHARTGPRATGAAGVAGLLEPSFSAELIGLMKAAQEESRQSLANIQVVTQHLAGSIGPVGFNGAACSQACTALPPPHRAPLGSAANAAGSPAQAESCSSTRHLGPAASLPAIALAEPQAVQPLGPADQQRTPQRPVVTRRVRAGAKLAQEHSMHAKVERDVPRKRRRTESSSFAAQLLEKAPSSLQTCRSLVLFLDRKLQANADAPPTVEGPASLRLRLEAFADSAGRLAGLREPGGWDARARRALDVAAHVASPSGTAALNEAAARLEGMRSELEAALAVGSSKGSLEAVTVARRAWARDAVRRAWFAWCAQLLRARESALLASAAKGTSTCSEVEAEPLEAEPRAQAAVDMPGVLQALLAGREPIGSDRERD